MGHFTTEITRNAEKINTLKTRIEKTYEHRDQNDHKRKEWESACADFHAQYESLAFPGGLDGAYERIIAGDPETVEAALCFLECRPYFFRSGYMFKDMLRKMKRTPLKRDQKARFDSVLAAYQEYRDSKKPT